MTRFQIGDIVERVLDAGNDSRIKLHGRYVVAEVSGSNLTIVKDGAWWMAEKFILIARGAGLELSQFINTGSQ